MPKQVLATFLCGFLALNLTACSIPFFGDKDIEKGDLESSIVRTPDEHFYLMFDKMRNEIKTADYQAEVVVDATIDQSELSKGTKSVLNNELLSFGVNRPYVLGVDSFEALKASKPSSDSQASLFDFGKNKIKVKLDYEVEGKFDYNDEENHKGESKMQMEVDANGLIVRFDFETKLLNDNVYIKVGQLPPPFSMIVDPEKLDSWLYINFQELENEQQKENGVLTKKLPSDFDYDMYFNDEKSKALEAEMGKIINKYKIFKVGEVLAEETIDGSLCYHYKIELNKNIIKTAFLEIYSLVEAEMDKSLEALAMLYKDDEKKAIEIEEVRDGIDAEIKGQVEEVLGQLVNIVDEYDLSVWIDQETHFLRKTKFDFKLNLKNLELKELSEEIKDAVEIDLEGVMTYSNINQAVDIVAPIESESIISFLNDMFSDSGMKSRNARRLSDVKQIQSALELFYNDNEYYPDSLAHLSTDKVGYMRVLPENPEPSDGDCPVGFDYSYQVEKNKQDYKLSYCLGISMSGVPAGENTASAKGIYNHLKPSLIQQPENINFDISPVTNLDTDLDGLFDQDEISIYKTDPNNSDTDGDGYLDGDEVRNGYNPAGEGDLPISVKYDADWLDYDSDKFSIKYPNSWEADSVITNLSEEQKTLAGIKVIFLSPYKDDSDTFKENVLVSIIDLKDTRYKTVDDWYQESASKKNEDQLLGSNKISIQGQPGIEVIYTTAVENDLAKTKVRHLERYFIEDQKLYSFQFSGDHNSEEVLEYQSVAIKLIESFNLKK